MDLRKHIPAAVHEIAEHLVVRIAGGAVRDILLGIEPKDFDLATPHRPEEVVRVMEAAGYTVIPTGLKHGTVTVVVDKVPYEITTLRIDVETDGRHAEVVFTDDWKLDAERRDLTINSMFLDTGGNVTDHFGGQEDLDAGLVRFVGDAVERITEDYLRILRYFRFCGRMGHQGDAFTMDVIAEHAKGLKKISGERIWMEMEKILTGQIVATLLEDMKDTGVLEAIGVCPKALAIDMAYKANCMQASPATVLSALLNGDVDNAEKLAAAWNMSKDDRKLLVDVTKETWVMHSRELEGWKRVAVVQGKQFALEAISLTGNVGMRMELGAWVPPTFPVRGSDLLDKGMHPGPEVGKKLAELKTQWMNSQFKLTRDELLAD